jgi:hypothetical protein
MPFASARSDEASRRRRAIYQALQPDLPPAVLHQALALCERDFPVDRPFSVAEFCQRLAGSSAEISLSREARLALLRAMRQPVEKLGIDPRLVQEARGEASSSETLEVEAESGLHRQELIDEDDEEMVALTKPDLESLAGPPTDQVAYCTATGRPYRSDQPSPELFALRYANFGQPIEPFA